MVANSGVLDGGADSTASQRCCSAYMRQPMYAAPAPGGPAPASTAAATKHALRTLVLRCGVAAVSILTPRSRAKPCSPLATRVAMS